MLFRSQESVCLLVICLAACIACDSQDAFGEDPPTQLTQHADWEAQIEAALDAKGDWAFEDVPLSELCDLIQYKLGIDLVLDVKSLEDHGIDPRTPITRSLRGLSNRSLLHLILGELELIYTMQHGALWITTHEIGTSQLIAEVYPAGDLLRRNGTLVSDFSLLIEAIKCATPPRQWSDFGGWGAIEGIHDAIVVMQSFHVHEQIREFLATYRVIIANDRGGDEPEQTVFMLRAAMNSVVHAALDKPLTAEFKDLSFKEAVEVIADAMDIPIVIDTQALEDFGIDTSTPVSQKFTSTPLRFALARLLYRLELTYSIRDEVLFITTPEERENQQDVGLYPVRDLVEVGDDSSIEPLGARCDFDALTDLIQSTVAPDTWESVGGPSSIGTLLPAPTIVISQTQEAHEEISELLTKLRAAKKLEAARSAASENVDPVALIVRSYPIYAAYHDPDEIVKLVMRASEPGTWDDEAGTFVQGLGPSLVVKHNASGHRQVQKLLSQLGVWSPLRRGKPWLGGGSFQPGASAQPGSPGGGGGFF